MKVLILSDNVEHEHDSVEYALEEAFRQKGHETYTYIQKQEEVLDAIVMTHTMQSDIIACIKNDMHANPLVIKVASDYSLDCDINEDADIVVIPSSDLRKSYVDKGIDDTKLYEAGIPVLSKFSQFSVEDKDRLRAKAGYKREDRIYLLLCTNIKSGKTIKAISELCRRCIHNEKVIIICDNKKIRNSMSKELYNYNNVKIVSSVLHKAEYMAISDVIYMKPDALLSTEAAIMQKPIIYMKADSNVEKDNMKYYTDRGMAYYSEDILNEIRMGEKLMYDNKTKDEMISAQQCGVNDKAALSICTMVEEQVAFKRGYEAAYAALHGITD